MKMNKVPDWICCENCYKEWERKCGGMNESKNIMMCSDCKHLRKYANERPCCDCIHNQSLLFRKESYYEKEKEE